MDFIIDSDDVNDDGEIIIEPLNVSCDVTFRPEDDSHSSIEENIPSRSPATNEEETSFFHNYIRNSDILEENRDLRENEPSSSIMCEIKSEPVENEYNEAESYPFVKQEPQNDDYDDENMDDGNNITKTLMLSLSDVKMENENVNVRKSNRKRIKKKRPLNRLSQWDIDPTSFQQDFSQFVTELPGKRIGNTLYQDGSNFVYRKNKIQNGKLYLRCANTGCDAKLVISDKKQSSGKHNHQQVSQKEINKALFVRRCLELSINTSVKPRIIFDMELARFTEDIPEVPYEGVRNSMIKCRKRYSTSLPAKIETSNEDIPVENPVCKQVKKIRPLKCNLQIKNPILTRKDDDFSHFVTISPGKRSGTTYYRDNETNFAYKKNRGTKDKLYLICVKKYCSAKLIVSAYTKKTTGKHNHQQVSQREFNSGVLIQRCMERSQTSSESLRSIYNIEMAKFNKDIPDISYKEVQNAMYKRRRKTLPPIPESIEDIDHLLMSTRLGLTHKGRSFYKTTQINSDSSKTVIFISDIINVIDSFEEFVDLHADSTWQILPSVPKFSQFFTLHIEYKGYNFPILYALMTKCSYIAYRKLLKFLVDEVPLLNPQNFYCDYEPELIRAAMEVFEDIPGFQTKGCLFHYLSALMRRISSPDLNLKDLYMGGTENDYARDLLRSYFALPLMKPSEMEDALSYLIDQIDEIEDQDIRYKITEFHNYISGVWISTITPKTFSIVDEPKRSNNVSEIFHNQLPKSLRLNEKLWNFIDKLSGFDSKLIREYTDASKDVVLRNRKMKYLTSYKSLEVLRTRLNRNMITIREFLIESSSFIKKQSEYVEYIEWFDTQQDESNSIELDISNVNYDNWLGSTSMELSY